MALPSFPGTTAASSPFAGFPGSTAASPFALPGASSTATSAIPGLPGLPGASTATTSAIPGLPGAPTAANPAGMNPPSAWLELLFDCNGLTVLTPTLHRSQAELRSNRQAKVGMDEFNIYRSLLVNPVIGVHHRDHPPASLQSSLAPLASTRSTDPLAEALEPPLVDLVEQLRDHIRTQKKAR